MTSGVPKSRVGFVAVSDISFVLTHRRELIRMQDIMDLAGFERIYAASIMVIMKQFHPVPRDSTASPQTSLSWRAFCQKKSNFNEFFTLKQCQTIWLYIGGRTEVAA